MKITVRGYTPADVKAIATLEAECFSDPWSENAVTEAAEYGTAFFMAECDGRVVGYIGVKPVLDEGFISNIAVGAEMRGKGIGSALMEAVLEFAKAKPLASVSLEVRPSNAAAIALYEKFGYKEVGRRRNFYSHPTEDGLIMTLEVD